MRKILFSLVLVGCGTSACGEYVPLDEAHIPDCSFFYEDICVVKNNLPVSPAIIQMALSSAEYGFSNVNPLVDAGFEPDDVLGILQESNTHIEFMPYAAIGNMYRGATASGDREWNDKITIRFDTRCQELVFVLGHEMLHVVMNWFIPGTSHSYPGLFLEWAYKEEKETGVIVHWEYVTEYHVWLKAAQLCNEYDNASFVSDG